MSRVIVSMVGGTVPMTGALLEARMFDLSFAGPVARLPTRLPLAIPALETSLGRPPPQDDVRAAAPTIDIKNPDEVKYTKVHKVAYTDLKYRGVSLPDLRLLLSSSEGMRKLSNAFTDEGAMAISTSNPVKLDWNLDAALVPYHMAGCLCMISSIAGKPAPGELPAFVDLYKRYEMLVREILVFCVDARSTEEHTKDFRNIILRHAGSTADYLSFFVRTRDVLRLSIDKVNVMNNTWVNKLLNPMRKRVALIRARLLAEHVALLAFHAWNQADEEELVETFLGQPRRC